MMRFGKQDAFVALIILQCFLHIESDHGFEITDANYNINAASYYLWNPNQFTFFCPANTDNTYQVKVKQSSNGEVLRFLSASDTTNDNGDFSGRITVTKNRTGILFTMSTSLNSDTDRYRCTVTDDKTFKTTTRAFVNVSVCDAPVNVTLDSESTNVGTGETKTLNKDEQFVFTTGIGFYTCGTATLTASLRCSHGTPSCSSDGDKTTCKVPLAYDLFSETFTTVTMTPYIDDTDGVPFSFVIELNHVIASPGINAGLKAWEIAIIGVIVGAVLIAGAIAAIYYICFRSKNKSKNCHTSYTSGQMCLRIIILIGKDKEERKPICTMMMDQYGFIDILKDYSETVVKKEKHVETKLSENSGECKQPLLKGNPDTLEEAKELGRLVVKLKHVETKLSENSGECKQLLLNGYPDTLEEARELGRLVVKLWDRKKDIYVIHLQSENEDPEIKDVVKYFKDKEGKERIREVETIEIKGKGEQQVSAMLAAVKTYLAKKFNKYKSQEKVNKSQKSKKNCQWIAGQRV